MLKTLVQRPALVYGKARQVLSGFSIDKFESVVLCPLIVATLRISDTNTSRRQAAKSGQYVQKWLASLVSDIGDRYGLGRYSEVRRFRVAPGGTTLSLTQTFQISAGTRATTEAGRRVTTALRPGSDAASERSFLQNRAVNIRSTLGQVATPQRNNRKAHDRAPPSPCGWLQEASGINDFRQIREADLASSFFFCRLVFTFDLDRFRNDDLRLLNSARRRSLAARWPAFIV